MHTAVLAAFATIAVFAAPRVKQATAAFLRTPRVRTVIVAASVTAFVHTAITNIAVAATAAVTVVAAIVAATVAASQHTLCTFPLAVLCTFQVHVAADATSAAVAACVHFRPAHAVNAVAAIPREHAQPVRAANFYEQT